MNTRHHYLSLLRTFALATLTAAAVTACTDDNGDRESLTPDDGNGGIPVTFTANINPGSDADPAGAPDTRTVLTPTTEGGFTVTWKGKDTYTTFCDLIRIWAAQGNTLANSGWDKTYVPTTSEASSPLEPLNTSNKITLPSAGEWNFTAIYGADNTNSGKAPAFISPLTQSKPGNTKHIADYDFSVATATQTVTANSDMPANISFKFKHMLSALQLQVKNGTGETLTVNEIRLSVTGGKITTQKYYGVTDKGWIDDGKLESDYLQLEIQTPAALASNAADPQKFHMLLFPGYENKTLTITVITNRGEYTLTKPAPASPGFAAGKNYLTDITIKSSGLDPNKETWTETIRTVAELKTFRDNVNNGDNYQGKTVRLAANITLTGTWTPIGTSLKPFKGTFDGGGYSISGLNVSISEYYAGLFGYVVEGTVRNLRVSGKVKTTGMNAGGIAGYLSGSTVETCIFDGDVSGMSAVGGIAGYSRDNSRIAGCYTKGSVTASSYYAGGIAGGNYGATIDGCYSEADATTVYGAGGIAGLNENGDTITRCYATGKVSGKSFVGGIVGNNYGTTVTNCFALNPGITRTSGNITTFGRIVGKDEGSSSVASCYAFKDMTITDNSGNTVTPGATSVAGTDLTAANCLTKTTYTDREFTTANGWAFDTATPWAYLLWNPAFASFSGITEADYRISVPQHITNALSN